MSYGPKPHFHKISPSNLKEDLKLDIEYECKKVLSSTESSVQISKIPKL